MPRGNETDTADDWVPARLIPVGKMRQEEQETRGTSVLLSVLPVVPTFGRALLADLGAPRGQISTFTEVRLKDEAGKTHIPDGAIVVERGQTRWSCLVEAKTGRALLGAEQVARYLDMARLHGFDAVLTISNQIRSDAETLPYDVDKRKVGKLTVRHISWWRILTEAIVQHRFRGVDDPEQAWILSELIRYLDDERSGCAGFEGMGEDWVRVRESARNETLRAGDSGTQSVAARWEQLVQYVCLHLSQELGVDVKQVKKRGKGARERLQEATKQLAEAGVLGRSIRVPDAIAPVGLEANLKTRRVTTSVELDAPKDLKRPQAKINWLLKQLRDAPGDLRIEVRFASSRLTSSELLSECREDPGCLLSAEDPKRVPRAFVLARSLPMGTKAGLGKGSFVAETRRQVTNFYRELVQDLRPPQPKAPKLPTKEEEQQPPDVEGVSPGSEADARKGQNADLQDLAVIGGDEELA